MLDALALLGARVGDLARELAVLGAERGEAGWTEDVRCEEAVDLVEQQVLAERDALVRTALETGEPNFERFAELLAAKESPYVDFLRQQAAATRAEQARHLERAHDRAYLAMHAPVVPLLTVLVLLVAYGSCISSTKRSNPKEATASCS